MADEGNWREHDFTETGDYWKPQKIKECIEGYFRGYAEGNFGEYGVLEVEGDEIGLPDHRNLKAGLRGIEEGEFIRICLVDKQEIEGQDNKKFIYRIFIRE